MTDIMEKQPPKVWQWFQRIAVTIALIASLATVFSVWKQVKSNTPHMTATVIESESLTKTPNVPKLKSTFTYDNRDVSDFWRLRISLVNDGEVTVIGDGVQKNIVKDAIAFTLNGEYEILGVEVENSNFSNKVNLQSAKQFDITFLQWRKSEQLTLRLYLEKKGKGDQKPEFCLSERPIIDGDITILDNTQISARTKKPIIDYTHPLIATSSRALSASVAILTGLFCLIGMIIIIHELRVFCAWRKENLNNLITLIRGSELNEEDKESYQRSLKKISKEFWTSCTIPEPDIPSNYSTENKPYRPTIIILIVTSMFLIISLISISCILRF